MSRIRFHRIRAALWIIALVGMLAFPIRALAHASLVRSDPAGGSSIDAAPPRVNLWFSESLEASFSRVQVLDSTGAPVDQNDSRVESTDPRQMSVGLSALPPGVYTVAWRALSAVDGHVTKGVFTFGVGAEAAAAPPPADASPAPAFAAVVSRWLGFVGALLLIGGLVFRLWMWRPVQRGLSIETDEPALAGQPWLGALIVLVAAIMALFDYVTSASDSDVLASITNGSLGHVLFSTRYGALALARISLVLIAIACLPKIGSSGGDRRARWALAVSIASLLTNSLIAHAAARRDPTLPVIVDVLHLTANTIWIGGLALFARLLYAIRRWPDLAVRARATALLVPRFSALGITCVATLALTGLMATLLNFSTVDQLIGTPYGQALLVKTILFVGLLGLGAFNLLIVSRRLTATKSQPDRSRTPQHWLLRSVRLEIALASGVLLAAALMVNLPPPQSGDDRSGVTLNQTAGDLDVTLWIDPGRLGGNTFEVRLVDSIGQPVDSAKKVSLRFRPPSTDLGENVAEASPIGGGRYAVRGNFLSLVGVWKIEVAVQRPDAYDAFARFDLDLSGGAAATGLAQSWDVIAALIAISAGAAYAAAMLRLTRSRLAGSLAGIVPGLAMAGVGVSLTLGALAATPTEIVNPIQPDARSLSVGKTLYEQHCFVCHGPTGKGDGPAALRLNPRPVDLRQHMLPGVHPDAQLFDWISNGYPNSPMPSFASALSENDRWDVLNYIRTFANGQ